MKINHPAVTFGLCTLMTSPWACADFIGDSKASLNLRNFYFNNDNRDGSAAPSKTEEWGQAFILNAQSGFTDGTVGLGVDVLAQLGIRLDSGQGRHVGSTMFPDDGDEAAQSFGRLGLTAKMRVSRTELRYGTLIPKLPILMPTDGRLLPQTFEGGQVVSNEIDGLTLTAGLIEHAIGRGSSDRTGLAVSGGTRESNHFYFAGGDYKVTERLLAQYYYANLEDYYTQHFTGLTHDLSLGGYGSLKTDLRYFKTDSDGANASASGRAEGYKVGGYSRGGRGEIDNDTWSAAFIYSLGGHAFTLGYQQVSDNSNFVQLNQGSLADKGAGGAGTYLYTDRLIQNFTRAGERTRFGQYAYDFAALGVPGLKASVMYLYGDRIETFSGPRQKEWERDLMLDYVIQGGTFKGVGFAWRNGVSRSEASRHQDQNRLTLSYTLPLF
ncbi:OprD family porin [Pseudomonas sp. R5(2019)]|uniref:OprD family porin n=1 Tax=Pseudomonas sp. R5(2019) TaxID=2697566 RepID=UPI001413589F|nr:OprD family porin [Pseudomonas sp. R5(2019)]NBA95894.1 outer membrane porin, OprD family [Pseudomonas sp. R5(2019)]